jgi:hypothetical protein
MSSQKNVSKDYLSTKGHRNCLQCDVLKAAFQLGMMGGCLQSSVSKDSLKDVFTHDMLKKVVFREMLKVCLSGRLEAGNYSVHKTPAETGPLDFRSPIFSYGNIYKKTPQNSFYLFKQQRNLLHF